MFTLNDPSTSTRSGARKFVNAFRDTETKQLELVRLGKSITPRTSLSWIEMRPVVAIDSTVRVTRFGFSRTTKPSTETYNQWIVLGFSATQVEMMTCLDATGDYAGWLGKLRTPPISRGKATTTDCR